MSDFEYVCDRYKVPACYARSVTVNGRVGIITKPMGQYIGVTFDDDKPSSVLPCHPEWEVVYGDIRPPRKLTLAQKRYQRYRELSDCFDSFVQFLYSDSAKEK